MIKIKITNYKAIKNATFSINGLSVLRGVSNQGKSSIIQAIKAAMLNRFNGTCVRHTEEKAQIAFSFSDISDSLFYVTRKAAGGSPIYTLKKQNEDPFVLSKLNRDAPPDQFSKPFGVTKVPIDGSTEYLNFLDQFIPPLTLNLDAKKIIEVFSNSQLLKEYERVHSALTDRRPILKGQTTSIEQVFYDTSQQLITANALYQKLPSREEMMKLRTDSIELDQKERAFKLLKEKREEFLKVKGLISKQKEIETLLKEVESSNTELVNTAARLQSTQFLRSKEIVRLNLLNSSVVLDSLVETVEEIEKMERKYYAVQRLLMLTGSEKILTSKHEILVKIDTESVSALDKQSSITSLDRLKDIRSTYLTVTNSIKTLKGLTSEEACPLCGSTLQTHGQH